MSNCACNSYCVRFQNEFRDAYLKWKLANFLYRDASPPPRLNTFIINSWGEGLKENWRLHLESLEPKIMAEVDREFNRTYKK